MHYSLKMAINFVNIDTIKRSIKQTKRSIAIFTGK